MLKSERSGPYLLVWEFHVRPRRESEFETIYGPNGQWEQFFMKADGFIRTELNRDFNNPRRYLTLDYWTSKDAYEKFHEQHRAEYKAIDQRCEGLTERETPLGAFLSLKPETLNLKSKA